MASHTPGPWEVYVAPEDKGGSVLITGAVKNRGPNTPWICDCLRGEVPTNEREANAKLIAAAPDLLAAHRRNVNMDVDAIRKEGRLAEVLRTVIKEARAAISKATS